MTFLYPGMDVFVPLQQIDDLIGEIRTQANADQRVLVAADRKAEGLTDTCWRWAFPGAPTFGVDTLRRVELFASG